MLMDHQQVGDPVGFAGPHQCSNLMPPSVHALGTREHQLQFLPHTSVKSELGLLAPRIPDSLALCTFANILRRELGSREVVIMILGSSTPAHRYSSSTWLVTPVRT